MSEVSKSYTSDSFDGEAKKKFDESWDRVFGKKKSGIIKKDKLSRRKK